MLARRVVFISVFCLAIVAAIVYARSAFQQKAQNAEAHFNTGMLRYEAKDVDGAIGEFRKALELKPYVAKWHHQLAVVLAEKGESEAAFASYREALRLAPYHEGWHREFIKGLCEKGQWAAGRAAYRNHRRVEFDTMVTFEIECSGYEPVGLRYFDEARKNPASAEARYNLAWTCSNAGSICMFWSVDAVGEFREALRLKPDYADAQHGLALALHQKKDFDGAIAEFQKAVALWPKDAGLHIDLGDAHRAKGDFEQAIEAYRAAVRVNPNDPLAAARLVRAVKDAPGAEGPATRLPKLAQEMPALAEAHEELGGAMLEQCDLDQAIRELREAIRLKPQLLLARHRLVGALAFKGDVAGILVEGPEAEALNPYPKGRWTALAEEFSESQDQTTRYRSLAQRMPGTCKPGQATWPPVP